MLTVLVNLIGIFLIVGIVWWFWIMKPKTKLVEGAIQKIVVENGVYSPSRIRIRAGIPVSLSFLRKDPSPCAEKVIFQTPSISKDHELNKETVLNLTLEKGEYEFTCQMQMYRGKVIAE